VSNLRPARSVPSLDQSAWWAGGAPEGERRSIVELIRSGTIDAELAALAWLLLEARVPVIVAAGPRLAGKTTLLTALLEFLPRNAIVHDLAGYAEDFEWLPEAVQLGWRPEHPPSNGAPPPSKAGTASTADDAGPPASPATGYLVASELSPHLPFYTWGPQARLAIRALSVGSGLGATIHADSLAELFDELRGPDVRLTDDELSHIGLVLILRVFRDGRGEIVRRVAAAHYVRPVMRDAGGHVQRLSPAVLATWDERRDTFEHFAWGILPELAERTGRRAGDFEAEQRRRRDLLVALAASGVDSFAEVRAAIESDSAPAGGHRH
jgi:hypothetical protein